MIIKKFRAKDVHDFYNFDFTFNERVNFLVGLNGSGKTTAIRLIQAIIFFDFEYIAKSTFTFASVDVLSNGGASYDINVIKNENSIIFNINGSSQEIIFNEKAFQSNYKTILTSKITNNDLTSYFDRERFNVINTNPVFSKFNSIEKPIFLGLERTLGKYHDDYNPNFTKPNALQDDDLALKTSIQIVHKYYERYKKTKEFSNRKMLDIAFDSFFSYHSIDFENYFSETAIKGMFDILTRTEELFHVVDKLDPAGTYKKKIKTLLNVLQKDKYKYDLDKKLTLDICFNLIQTNGLNELLKEFDQNKKMSELRYKPIKDFMDSINSFLNHSGKHLQIDDLGIIKIYRGSKPITLHTLSSGEKQLLMLLSHSYFGVKSNGSFIIDEPELSLHLSWQESLIKNIIKGSENIQYIFATHSPEIVGEYIDNCIYLSND